MAFVLVNNANLKIKTQKVNQNNKRKSNIKHYNTALLYFYILLKQH